MMEWDEDFDDDDVKDVTRRYLPETVAWTTDWTTGSLAEQLQREVFNVDPPFQRRSAWNDKKASLYIESLLIGCPVPPVTLAEMPSSIDTTYQYVVIDGKQRLGTLKRFAVDRELRLTGLEVLPELNGAAYTDVERLPEFARFVNLPIRTVILRNWQKDEVLQFVFHRLNTQVTPLSTHELRRSLMAGPFTAFLDQRSAESEGLQRILNIREPDYRLRDAELLLRALAFLTYPDRYGGNLKRFLDLTTSNLNRRWAKQRDSVAALADDIDEAISATFAIFGKDAFQRLEPDEESHEYRYTGRFNRAVFDVMVQAFRFADVRDSALSRTEETKAAFRNLNEQSRFASYLSATTKRPEAVNGRIDAWAHALEEVTEINEIAPRIRPASR